MSNVEHLFENALVALENDYYFGEWKRIEKDRHNTDGVSEEVLEAIWHLAIYTVYTHNPALEYDYKSKAILVEWIKLKIDTVLNIYPNGNDETEVLCRLLYDWEKENEM